MGLLLILFSLSSFSAGGCAGTTIESDQSAPRLPVEDFVRQRFVDEWPVLEALKYDSNAVPTLNRMLLGPKATEEMPYWGNILITLGLIGNDAALEAIRQYVITPEQFPTHLYATIARMSALRSLGVWVNQSSTRSDGGKTNGSVVISDLVSFINRSGTMKPISLPTDPKVIIPLPEQQKRKRLMKRSAIWGLALTGNSEAKDALEELNDTVTDPSLKFLINDARRVHSDIQKVGLVCHYQKDSQECQKAQTIQVGFFESIKNWFEGLFESEKHQEPHEFHKNRG